MSNREAATGPTLSSRVYARVKRLIVSGDLAPGSVLEQEYVADKLGVSRTPVSQAIERLDQDDLIAKRTTPSGRDKWCVPPLTKDHLRDVIRLLKCVEGNAIVSLSEVSREDGEPGTLESLAGLEQDGSETREWFERELDFHHALVASTERSPMERMHERLLDHFSRYVRAYLWREPAPRETAHGETAHGEVVKNLRDGSVEEALETSERHWTRLHSLISSIVEERGELGVWMHEGLVEA